MLQKLKARGTGAGDGRRARARLAAAGDAELLRGGADGFDVFYRRHHRWVLVHIGRRVRDAEVALDLTSEVFAAAYLARRRYAPELGSARAWLRGIAANKIARHARDERAAYEARLRLGMERRTPPDAALAEVEALIAAGDMLVGLPPQQSAAIWQRHVLDHSYDRIAAAGGVTETTARKRVSVGLARLAERAGA